MKHKKQPVCPGCGKHCPLSAVRCKYGRNYIEKLNAPEERSGNWKKRITKGGELHLLLTTAKGVKRALKENGLTEEQLMSHMPPDQLTLLSEILRKISEKLPEPV